MTGSEGFIGSHLVEEMVRRGYRVRALVLYNSFDSWGWLDALPPDIMANVEVVLGDVRDAASVRELAAGADVLYHLAALIAIPYSYRSPRSYVDTNVIGTLNVMDTARQLGTPRIVHTSTSEVYGTARTVPISEDHPLQGQSPYSASKIGADKIAESFQLSFGLPVATLRPFNTYGPRQSSRAIIPTILSQLSSGATEIHIGDTRPTRDFTFVADTVRAFIAVGEAPAAAVVGRVLNAGTGVEISIGELAQLIFRVTGRDARIKQDAERLRPADSEVMRLLCDNTRLREATGWSPEVDLADGIARTAEWLARPDNLARYKSTRYTI
ncbi:MAG TPA: GDP-mannose 4,6-dehydratase [Candidatus Limnocylindrales bacterium]